MGAGTFQFVLKLSVLYRAECISIQHSIIHSCSICMENQRILKHNDSKWCHPWIRDTGALKKVSHSDRILSLIHI